MAKIIKILEKEKTHSSELVKKLSVVIEQHQKGKNLLFASTQARKIFKEYLQENYSDVFEDELKELFEVEPSTLVSSNYTAIYRNKMKGPKTIAIKFLDGFSKDYKKCMKTTKEINALYS